MTESLGPSSPSEIAPRLNAALAGLRNRRRLRAVLTALCAAVALGLLTLLGARVAAQLTVLPMAAEMLALGVAAITALAGLAVAVLRTPPLVEVARRADEQLALDERMASALEVAGDWPREGDNVIAAALIRDVEERASTVDPGRLVPLRSRALAGTAVAAVLAGVGALLVPASANVPQVSIGVEDAAVEQPAEDVTIEDAQIREIADLLRKDGERRNKEVLQAIANSLEKLADQRASGMPEEELSEQLRQLLDMAKEAYGTNLPAWMPTDTSNFAELEQRLEEKKARDAMPQNALSVDNYYDQGYYGPRGGNQKQREDRDSRSDADLQNMGMNQGSDDPSKNPDIIGEGGAPADPNMPFEAKPLESEEEVVASPAGAASDSNKGDSQMAGGGGEALTSEDLASAEYQASSDMSIRSEKPDTEGKRIRLELPPDVQASEAADANLGPGERNRAETDAVSRSVVDAQARGLVARYFARKQG